VDEALIDHVGAGGGFIGSGLVTTQMSRSLPAIVELSFEIDFLVFEDGETAGPDSEPIRGGIALPETGSGVHCQTDSIGNGREPRPYSGPIGASGHSVLR
jgi:hypothetical protein